MDQQKSFSALRHKIAFLYDSQRLRIQAAGRINNPKAKVELAESDKIFLAGISQDLDTIEKSVEKDVAKIVRQHPLWGNFLINIKGIGEKSAGVIISSADIHKSNTPSALWLYAGLGVVPHVKCSKCGHESWHNKGVCQKVVKTNKICGAQTVPIGEEKGIQRPIKGEKIGYNKWLKTKLLGVIAPNFLKCASSYRKYYDDYKNRLENMSWGRSKKHRHNAAMRYMTKMFLLDLWKAWRELEGLPVREPYAIEYLNKHKVG